MSNMEAPPTQPYYQPKKKSSVGIILIIIAAVCGLCCIGIVGIGAFGYKIFGQMKGSIGCGFAAAEYRDAIVLYAKDHDGKLPNAETWQDDVAKYLSKVTTTANGDGRKMLDIPGPNDNFCDRVHSTGLAFNLDLSGKPIDSIQNANGTILLFEVNGIGRNKAVKYVEPDPKLSPNMGVKDVPRGWVIQPLQGLGYLLGLNGQRTPIDTTGKHKGTGINVNVDTDSDNGN